MCIGPFKPPKPPAPPPVPAPPTPPPAPQPTQDVLPGLPDAPRKGPQEVEQKEKTKIKAGGSAESKRRVSTGTGQLATTAAGTGLNTGTKSGLQGINTGVKQQGGRVAHKNPSKNDPRGA